MDEKLLTFYDGAMRWKKVLELIQEAWDKDYGIIKTTETDEGLQIELITGGWFVNEEIIIDLRGTYFWFFNWQEAKRGGYYKFLVKED